MRLCIIQALIKVAMLTWKIKRMIINNFRNFFECLKCLKINPDFAGAHGNLGILLSGTGKKEEAKKDGKRIDEEEGREEDVKKAEEFFEIINSLAIHKD